MTNGLVRATLAVWFLASGCLLATSCGGRAEENLGGGGEGESSATGGVSDVAGSGGSTGSAAGGSAAGGSAAGGSAAGGSVVGEGSGGDSASGGDGVDPVDPCEGAIATCPVGSAEICDAEGRLLACDECGRATELGESCARLLEADREGGVVCAVVGRDELNCVGGFVEWFSGATFPRTLPAAPRALALADDSSATGVSSEWGGASFCLLDEIGSIFCTPEMSAFNAESCTDVSASAPRVCAVCGGEILCGDAPLAEGSATLVELSDEVAYWLDEDGSALATFSEEIIEGRYVDLFVNNFQDVCGIKGDGALACRMAGGGNLVAAEGDFVRGAAGVEQVCAITAASELACFVLSADSLAPAFAPSGNGYVEVVATTDKVCALTLAGKVQCWNAEGILEFNSGPFL